jgi:hypothetical protein
MAENARQKAARLLGQGRVTMRRLSDEAIEADVR